MENHQKGHDVVALTSKIIGKEIDADECLKFGKEIVVKLAMGSVTISLAFGLISGDDWLSDFDHYCCNEQHSHDSFRSDCCNALYVFFHRNVFYLSC